MFMQNWVEFRHSRSERQKRQNLAMWVRLLFTHCFVRFSLFCHELHRCSNGMKFCTHILHSNIFEAKKMIFKKYIIEETTVQTLSLCGEKWSAYLLCVCVLGSIISIINLGMYFCLKRSMSWANSVNTGFWLFHVCFHVYAFSSAYTWSFFLLVYFLFAAIYEGVAFSRCIRIPFFYILIPFLYVQGMNLL